MTGDGKFFIEVLSRVLRMQVQVYGEDGDTIEFGVEGEKLRVIEKEGILVGVAGTVKRVSIPLSIPDCFLSYLKNGRKSETDLIIWLDMK